MNCNFLVTKLLKISQNEQWYGDFFIKLKKGLTLHVVLCQSLSAISALIFNGCKPDCLGYRCFIEKLEK